MSDDPRGKTLWEMFVDWMRGDPVTAAVSQPAGGSDDAPPQPNPLGWEIGSSVQLSPQNGEVFAQPVIVRELRQIVRHIGGRVFTFADYVIQPHGADKARVRCVPDSTGESRLLLELVDSFPCEDGFLEVVNDDTGFFDVTNDDTGETDRFERINGVRGPYEAIVRTGQNVVSMEYWDWARVCPDGAEEFVFVEHLKKQGQIEIWRGWRLLE
jgi:hypothetical protein